VRDSKLD